MGVWGVGSDIWGVGAGVWGVDGDGPTPPTPVSRAAEPRHKAPGPLLCRVINPRGEWAYLNAYGHTSGLSFTWGTSGGPLSAQVSVDVPATADIPALTQNATFQVIRGASVGWVGRVASISKGSPWQVQVDGLGGLATREIARTTGSLTDILTASIDDEFPWVLPDDNTFDFIEWDTDDVPITTTLDVVLSTALTVEGVRWTVNNQGVVSALAEPDQTPTLLIRVSDPSIPVTLNKYATRVDAYYNDTDHGGAPAKVTVTNHVAEEKFDRVRVQINLTSSSISYTETQATNFANLYLDRVSPHLTLTGAFTVTNGQITTGTGGAVDLARVSEISGRRARLQFATPLRDALLGSVLSIDTQIGEVTYDDDNATLSVAPVDAGLTPAQILFGARGGGDRTDPNA